MFSDTKGVAYQSLVIEDGALGGGAEEILNFYRDQDVLVSQWRIMPMVPAAWLTPAGLSLNDVRGIIHTVYDGEAPELFLLCTSGVRRYAPWFRASTGGFETIQIYSPVGGPAPDSCLPTGRSIFPPQYVTIGNRIYFSWGGGGTLWCLDMDQMAIRPLGFQSYPAAPQVEGPSSTSSDLNTGGFSVQGRMGTTEGDWVDAGTTVGGIDDGQWLYYCLFENETGAYSSTSPPGGPAWIYRKLETSPIGGIETLRRRVRVYNIPSGPAGTVARILLRTPNILRSLEDQRPRFLTRIPHNKSVEWVDDLPDGELGAIWEHRTAPPFGAILMCFHAGSLFLSRTAGAPARVWWSEQGGIYGATPESFFDGHWLDVSPELGPNTALFPLRLGTEHVVPGLVVLKAGSAHMISGEYPNYRAGTIHPKAGCVGPGLVQQVPDGSTIWVGNGTVWRMGPEGQVADIGYPIRRRLGKVNWPRASMGVSWVDLKKEEVVFCVPYKDADTPDYQLCWDWKANGWRARQDISNIQAAAWLGDALLVSATWTGTQNLWVYGKGYQGSGFEGGPTAVWRSPWVKLSDGPAMHSRSHVKELNFILHERGAGTITVNGYSDFNGDTVKCGPETLPTAHPDDSDLAYWNTALWGTTKWRTQRYVPSRRALTLDSVITSQVKLEISGPCALGRVDGYLTTIARPGSRAPESA